MKKHSFLLCLAMNYRRFIVGSSRAPRPCRGGAEVKPIQTERRNERGAAASAAVLPAASDSQSACCPVL